MSTSSRITGTTAHDTEETCYIRYDSAIAKLTESKELEVSIDDVKSHEIRHTRYDNPYEKFVLAGFLGKRCLLKLKGN